MNQFKRAQVIMLPTEQKVNGMDIIILNNQFNVLGLGYGSNLKNVQHLYIISDDEIKEDDWCINICDNIVEQCKTTEYHNPPCINNTVRGYHKKIIATTDISLILLGEFNTTNGKVGYPQYKLPQPSQQFIEKYIESYNKGEVITDVLVEYETLYDIELLVNTSDFKKGSYIRGNCNTKNDFGKAKRRFMELHTDNNHLNIAIDTNSVKLLYKQYFKDIEINKLKINPKDNTITIKKLKDSWNREEIIEYMWKAYKEADTIFVEEAGLRREFDRWINKII